MEPLINVYVQEGFVFLAMRLLPEESAQNVQPVKLTYPSLRPMIPLRLTAVAANQDMAVMAWFYADRQAVPANYAEMTISDRELTFTAFGTSNYRQLMGDRADEYGGQAFITEYAAPARELVVTHPLLQDLGRRYAYVTRLNTVISPEEMTVDPVFDYDPQRKDVSNIHDLSDLKGVYDCEDQTLKELLVRAENPSRISGGAPEGQSWPVLLAAGTAGGLVVLLLAGLVLAGVWLGRRGHA